MACSSNGLLSMLSPSLELRESLLPGDFDLPSEKPLLCFEGLLLAMTTSCSSSEFARSDINADLVDQSNRLASVKGIDAALSRPELGTARPLSSIFSWKRRKELHTSCTRAHAGRKRQ